MCNVYVFINASGMLHLFLAYERHTGLCRQTASSMMWAVAVFSSNLAWHIRLVLVQASIWGRSLPGMVQSVLYIIRVGYRITDSNHQLMDLDELTISLPGPPDWMIETICSLCWAGRSKHWPATFLRSGSNSCTLTCMMPAAVWKLVACRLSSPKLLWTVLSMHCRMLELGASKMGIGGLVRFNCPSSMISLIKCLHTVSAKSAIRAPGPRHVALLLGLYCVELK